MSLQEAALARKEKLLALKKRKATHDEPSIAPSDTTSVPSFSLQPLTAS